MSHADPTSAPPPASPPASPVRPDRSGRVPVAGVSYYYEIYGQGAPLLLLHGGFSSIEMFHAVLGSVAETRQVIGVDLHGHGRTPIGERRLDRESMGDDLAAVLDQLGYGPVDVLGYSLGAIVGLRLAARHPAKVRRVALVSGCFARDGFHPEVLAAQAHIGAGMLEMMKASPAYESYARIAPDPSEFPRLLDEMGAAMRVPFDWRDDVKGLAMPVMLVYGDSDIFRLEHIVDFYHLLGGGLRDAGWQREHLCQNRLAILPNLTHYDLSDAPAMLATALPFLAAR